jgi:hypothetical protein
LFEQQLRFLGRAGKRPATKRRVRASFIAGDRGHGAHRIERLMAMEASQSLGRKRHQVIDSIEICTTVRIEFCR